MDDLARIPEIAWLTFFRGKEQEDTLIYNSRWGMGKDVKDIPDAQQQSQARTWL